MNPAPVIVAAAGVTAQALLLLRVTLSRPSNRADYPAAGVVVTGGAASAYSGQLDLLADTLADALALVDVYERSGHATPAVITGHDPTLDGWTHVLAGDPGISQETAVMGLAAPWLVSVPVRMATR